MSAARPPVVSVVVPTCARPASLARLLAALATQDPGVPWELVVVDNEPAPGAEAVFRSAALPADVPARLLRESQPGASHTRNRGMAEACGLVTVFVDDDVTPLDGWLRALVAPVLDGRCDGTGGTVVLDPSVARPRWFDEDGLAPYLAAHHPSDEERPVAEGEFVITASAAFRTDLLRRTGGMEPALGPRPGVQLVNDDVLLCDRFRALGGQVHHVPAAVVVHELPTSRLAPGYLLRRAHSQGRSDWIYFVRTIGRRGGAQRVRGWLAGELRARWREGPWRPRVAFHLACDLVRALGAGREAVTHSVGGSR